MYLTGDMRVQLSFDYHELEAMTYAFYYNLKHNLESSHTKQHGVKVWRERYYLDLRMLETLCGLISQQHLFADIGNMEKELNKELELANCEVK